MTRRRLAAALAHVPPGARLLDVGCGFTDVPARFAGYVGCDRNPVFLAANREAYPSATFVAWDVAAEEAPAPLLEAPFDAALMLAILEHLSDPAAALHRVAPLLRPGGTLVATTPHPLARRVLEAGASLGLLSRHADGEHEELLGRGALAAAGNAAGLDLVLYRRFLFGLNQLALFRRR